MKFSQKLYVLFSLNLGFKKIMSKLTETLNNNVQNYLENITIRFSTQQLDQDLLNPLGIYLCTKAPEKLIEVALALACGYYIDIGQGIISQIKYKPAQKLEEIISQRSQGETEKNYKKLMFLDG